MKHLQSFPADEKITNTRMYHEYHDLGMEDGWLPGNKVDNYQFMMKLMELTNIPLANTTCLDVGCGSGDLSAFLRKRGIANYFGWTSMTSHLRKQEINILLKYFCTKTF